MLKQYYSTQHYRQLLKIILFGLTISLLNGCANIQTQLQTFSFFKTKQSACEQSNVLITDLSKPLIHKQQPNSMTGIFYQQPHSDRIYMLPDGQICTFGESDNDK